MTNNLNRFFFMGSFYWLALILQTAGAEELKDPTRPPEVVVAPKAVPVISNQALNLRAIFSYPKYRVAIINGSTVKVGDRIGQFTIKNITPYTVELLDPQLNLIILKLVVDIKQKQ